MERVRQRNDNSKRKTEKRKCRKKGGKPTQKGRQRKINMERKMERE